MSTAEKRSSSKDDSKATEGRSTNDNSTEVKCFQLIVRASIFVNAKDRSDLCRKSDHIDLGRMSDEGYGVEFLEYEYAVDENGEEFRLEDYYEQPVPRSREVVYKTFVVGTDESEPRSCGECRELIPRGATVYYFHPEEDDYCSNECLQKHYKDDSEAHFMSLNGHNPESC